MRLSGKVVIVTGSASGLGEAMIIRAAREGAYAVVTDVNTQGMKEIVKEIENEGGTAIGVKADVTKRTEVKVLMETTVKRFGRIDILVNNAGVTRHRPYLEMTDEDWDFVLGVDLKGVFNCIQAVAPYMMEQRSGKIVNISSVAGTGTSPGKSGRANYEAAKAGVIQLTKTFARELGPHGVNVNCVAPGTIVTPITYATRTKEEVEKHLAYRKTVYAIDRIGKPEDVADAVLFFASNESDFITGQLLCVDGGRMDHM